VKSAERQGGGPLSSLTFRRIRDSSRASDSLRNKGHETIGAEPNARGLVFSVINTFFKPES
jgi:hypothetical protein